MSNELPWSIPGGQQVQFTPYQIGGRSGGFAEVINGGALQSEGFSTGLSGWRIDGAGNVEFNTGDFRGTLDAATISGGTISGADITASTLEIGAQPEAFFVDADGNIWSGAADFINAPFRVANDGTLTAETGTFTGTVSASTFSGTGTVGAGTGNTLESDNFLTGVSGWQIDGDGNAEFNDITARGTIQTAASGSRIELGNNGNDQLTFYDGSSTYPGYLEVQSTRITLARPGATQDSIVAEFGGSSTGSTQPGFIRGGLETYTPFSEPDGTYGNTMLTLWANAEWANEANDGPCGVRMDFVSSSTSGFFGYADRSSITNEDTWSIMAGPDNSYNGSYIGDPIATAFRFLKEGTRVAHFTETGNLVVDTDEIQIGNGSGFPGNWTSYEGMFHKDLADGYMMMSNGTDTFVGGDANVYIRPEGNSGAEYEFDADGAKFDNTYDVDVNASGGATPAFYTNWAHYGGSWANVRITRDPVGLVTIAGLVRRNTSASGAPNAILLTPTWARVSKQMMFTCHDSTGGLVRVDLYANGQVVTLTSIASGAWINLNLTYKSTASV